MLAAVVQELHGPARNWLTVQGDGPDTAFDTSRVFNTNSVRCGPVTIGDLEPRPSARNTRVDAQHVANRTNAENRFESNSIQPTGGPGVPGPSAAASVGWSGVDVGADDIRLDLILRDFGGCRGVTNRVQQVPEFQRSVTVALQCHSEHYPRGCVRILAAVFADARHVALDIARLQLPLVEWRGRLLGHI